MNLLQHFQCHKDICRNELVWSAAHAPMLYDPTEYWSHNPFITVLGRAAFLEVWCWLPLTSRLRRPRQCRPCSKTGLRKVSPGLSPCLESSLPVPPCNSSSIHLPLSLTLPPPHFHSHCLLLFPSSSHLFLQQSMTVTSIVLSAPHLSVWGKVWY